MPAADSTDLIRLHTRDTTNHAPTPNYQTVTLTAHHNPHTAASTLPTTRTDQLPGHHHAAATVASIHMPLVTTVTLHAGQPVTT
jgi:hypothetical protein